jgi:hypothetical protein
MGFKGIKGFGLSKTKDKNNTKSDTPTDSVKVIQMKDQVSIKTKLPEEPEQKLNGLIANSVVEATGPHGPIGELSLEPAGIDKKESPDDDIVLPGGGEPIIKVVEMSKKPDANKVAAANGVSAVPKAPEVKAQEKPPAPAVKPEVKPISAEDSLSNLFSSHEEEANPLASLISSLPDVTAQELVDDLNEIKGIIKEWQKG